MYFVEIQLDGVLMVLRAEGPVPRGWWRNHTEWRSFGTYRRKLGPGFSDSLFIVQGTRDPSELSIFFI